MARQLSSEGYPSGRHNLCHPFPGFARAQLAADIGRRLLARVSEDLAAHSVVEQNPLMEGKQMVMVFAPKKK